MRLFKPNIEKLEQQRNVRGLAEALKDKEASVREAAASALDRIGVPDDPAVRAWYAVVRRDWAAAEALDDAAVAPLCSSLDNSDASIRHAAAETLGRVGQPAVWHLVYILKNEALEQQAREAVVHALASIGEPAVEPLCELFEESPEIARFLSAQVAASHALAAIGSTAVDPIGRKLLSLRDRRSVPIALTLGEIGDPSAIRFLAATLENCSIPAGQTYQFHVRQAATQALGRIGGRAAVAPLIKALSDVAEEIRAIAAEALGETGDPGAVGLLCAHLEDKNEQVHNAAMRALVKIGSPAVGALSALLKRRDWDSYHSRGLAAKALGEIGDARAAESLCAALTDGAARREAEASLMKFGETAVGSLRAVANGPDRRLAKAASKVLRKIIATSAR